MDFKLRRQLTLFVSKQNGKEIENLRSHFNPIQYSLIDSHVTLCREDEIENIERLLENLQSLNTPKIVINFGQAIRFDNGKGVLLPSLGGNDAFHMLRSKVLFGLQAKVAKPEPHITLMHPRNSSCTDETFSVIQKMALPTQITFETISLIEQINGGRWEIIKSYKLNNI